MIRIYHHDDLDGFSSGYLVGRYFKGSNINNIKYYEMGYDSNIDLDELNKEDEVYIVDYHFPIDIFKQIQDKVQKVVWIDHHISAINEYNEYYKEKGLDINKEIEGFWKNGDSATLLTYKYLFSDYDMDIPTWVFLVDAWDAWKTDSKYYENAELLNLAVQNSLSIELIKEIDTKRNFYLDLIEIGSMYKDYRDEWSDGFAKKYGFETSIELEDGTIASAYVLSLGNANSKFFGDKINKYDFCITQGFDGEKWNISVYSDKENMDCSKLAQHFGGGGHAGAAGFTYNKISPLFVKN